MRKVLLFVLFCSILIPAAAQQRISAVVGVHRSSISPSFPLLPGASGQLMESKSGFHFGFIADLPFQDQSGWHFQPGVIYSTKGAKQKQYFDTAQTKNTFYQYNQNVNYIDIPLNIVYKFPSATNSRLIIGGGPMASLFYSGNITSSVLDTLGVLDITINRDLPSGNGDQQFRGLHWGVNFLAGVEFGKAYITANYNKSLTPYSIHGNHQFKHGSLGVTLGIFISSPKESRQVRDGVYGCPAWW